MGFSASIISEAFLGPLDLLIGEVLLSENA